MRTEVVHGRGIGVSERLVRSMMHDEGILVLTDSSEVREDPGISTSAGQVECRCARLQLNGLWVRDITGYTTRNGKVYCCVTETCSLRIVGRSIHSVQGLPLALDGSDMAVGEYVVRTGGVMQAECGILTPLRAFSEKVTGASVMPLARSGDDALVDALTESFDHL